MDLVVYIKKLNRIKKEFLIIQMFNNKVFGVILKGFMLFKM